MKKPKLLKQTLLAFLLGIASNVLMSSENEIIPHAGVIEGERNINQAWLAGATNRYAHGILGDSIEASSLIVRLSNGETRTINAEDNSVFEDLSPRIVDVDNDGIDEVMTIQSDASSGARVVVFRVTKNAISKLSSKPIGVGYRWLNPVGVADVTGDQKNEFVYIQTPHIGGIVIVATLEGNSIKPVATKSGYSNHAIGSTYQDLGLLQDLDGDKVFEIIVPDQSRTRLAILYFQNGQLVEFWKSATGPRIVGNVSFIPSSNSIQYLTPSNETFSVELPKFNH